MAEAGNILKEPRSAAAAQQLGDRAALSTDATEAAGVLSSLFALSKYTASPTERALQMSVTKDGGQVGNQRSRAGVAAEQKPPQPHPRNHTGVTPQPQVRASPRCTHARTLLLFFWKCILQCAYVRARESSCVLAAGRCRGGENGCNPASLVGWLILTNVPSIALSHANTCHSHRSKCCSAMQTASNSYETPLLPRSPTRPAAQR